MELARSHQLEIPRSLSEKLLAFRKRVWTLKLLEAAASAAFGVLVAFLVTYLVDRFVDTPAYVRTGIFVAALVAFTLIPFAMYRWVWRHRQMEQLARLLSRRHPSVGDQLLGILELSRSESEQQRSMTLVQAAIHQVAEVAEKRDFRDAVPSPRYRSRLWMAGAAALAAVALFVVTPAAAKNALARFAMPWKNVPRYTFAAVSALPEKMVIPHGESFTVNVRLEDGSEWRPDSAQVELPGYPPMTASLTDAGYAFELPGQIAPGPLQVRVGDFRGKVELDPMLRPELSGVTAQVSLPDYLGRTAPVERDVRGGAMSLVKGAQAVFTATASRDLAAATINQEPRQPSGSKFASDRVAVVEDKLLNMEWKDAFGLTGKAPFELSVKGSDDEAPTLLCEDLPRQKVLLDSEVLTFKIRARDDFGVRAVGIEWKGIDVPEIKNPAKGEKIVGAGAPESDLMELTSTFSAEALKIEPQPIQFRVFVEDYLPGRGRIYSPVCVFDILTAEEHAIWITAQLSRWQKQSLEVRDKEMQLHETNKALRELAAEELDKPETRRKIETQASAERVNGRRLTALVGSGEDLLKQAMRNPEIGVGHLEKWAEMMGVLKDISANRMPSVADLLKQSANSPQLAQNTPSNNAPQAGQIRAGGGGSDPKKGGEAPKKPTQVPSIADVESTMNQPKPGEAKEPTESKPKSPRLTLPNTMLAGNAEGKKGPPPASQKLDEAVVKQQDLLAEFEKISDELNKVLANLEGTTLVKRLKASSRTQGKVATRLGGLAAGSFGLEERAKEPQGQTFKDLAELESKSSHEVSTIMDDMHAYFDRSRFMRFKVVLDDMRKQDVTGGLRTLGDELRKENGLSISQAEFWSDSLDRWAEDLVEVTKCGACPGCKSKGSLPPSIVLEVLKVLESEVNLREETRVAEQARKAIKQEEHDAEGKRLGEAQKGLRQRIDKVVERIIDIPDGAQDFGKEIALLEAVSDVMTEATRILGTPNTGKEAVAAETEAIELLLQSKRFNPKGGGGGGSSPGGGGGGTTNDSALALVGNGLNEKELRQDHGVQQTTGATGPVLPEEFRSGLDEYFNRLEGRVKE
jgi:hypothetical protein